MEISEISKNIICLQVIVRVSVHGSTICATQSIQECQWRGSKLSMLGMGCRSEAQWSCTFFPALAGCLGSNTVLLAGLNKGAASKEIHQMPPLSPPGLVPKEDCFNPLFLTTRLTTNLRVIIIPCSNWLGFLRYLLKRCTLYQRNIPEKQ